MPYAVELYLDQQSSERVRGLKEELKSRGIDVDEGTRSHISLSIYGNLNLMEFRTRLERFAEAQAPFSISLASIGIFATESPIIYLAPTVTMGLLQLHQDFCEFFSEYDGLAWDYYRPGLWVPHCTLAMNLDGSKVKEAVDIICRLRLPLYGILDKIGVLEFSPNKELFEFNLPVIPQSAELV